MSTTSQPVPLLGTSHTVSKANLLDDPAPPAYEADHPKIAAAEKAKSQKTTLKLAEMGNAASYSRQDLEGLQSTINEILRNDSPQVATATIEQTDAMPAAASTSVPTANTTASASTSSTPATVNTTASASTSSTTTASNYTTETSNNAVFKGVTVAAKAHLNHLSHNNNGRTANDAVAWQATFGADFSNVTVEEGGQLNSGSHNGNVGHQYDQAGNSNGGGQADNEGSAADMVLDMLNKHLNGGSF